MASYHNTYSKSLTARTIRQVSRGLASGRAVRLLILRAVGFSVKRFPQQLLQSFRSQPQQVFGSGYGVLRLAQRVSR